MKKIVYTENFEQANRIIEGEKSVLSDGCRGLILQDLSAPPFRDISSFRSSLK